MPDQISDQVPVGGGQNIITGQTQPTRTVTLTADPQQEYVAGAPQWLGVWPHALAWSIDDLTDAFDTSTESVYARMRFDAMVAACVRILKTAILQGGARLSPATEDKADPNYAAAVKAMQFCQQVLDDLDPSLDVTLWGLADALAYGNKVAEKVYDYDATYTGKTQVVLRAVKVKPKRSTAFVVDQFRNVVGLLALRPGMPTALTGWGSIIVDPAHQDNLYPRDKFAVLSWEPEEDDPRGTSMLRPAFTAWQMKTQLWAEYGKFLSQFCSPVPVGTFAASNDFVPLSTVNPTTGALISPQQALLTAIQAGWKNGAAIALPPGADVKTLFGFGEGAAFLSAFNKFDEQIAIAILGQSLAQGSAQEAHSRAASQVHERVTDTIVAQARPAIARMIRTDLLRQLIAFNESDPDAVRLLTPKVSIGAQEVQDRAAILTALGRAGYTLHESQFPGIDEQMDIPERDLEAVAQEKAEAEAQQQAHLDALTQGQQAQPQPAQPRQPAPNGPVQPAPATPAPQPAPAQPAKGPPAKGAS